MNFAANMFREELASMVFIFNGHYQKLEWVSLAATGAVEFPPFLDWIKADEKRAADFRAIGALDEEAAAAAAKANVVAARGLANRYYNGLFILYRDYDKAIEDAYRAHYRQAIAQRGQLAMAGGGA